MALPLGILMSGLNIVGQASKAQAEAKFKMISLAVTGGIGVLTLIVTLFSK